MKNFLIFLLLIATCSTTRAAINIKNLAQVYNITITEQDLEDRIIVLAAMNQVSPESFAPYKSKLLQDMIKEEVFLHQAKKFKIKIEQPEIDEVINFTETSRNLPKGTIADLISKHADMERSFKAQIAKNNIVQGYIAPKIFVTDAEIEKQSGSTKKTILASIASIEVSGDNIDAKKTLLENIETKVSNCSDFEKYAQQNNLEEILYINNKIDDLNEALRNFVTNANVGQVTNLLQIDETHFQMLMLCEKMLVDNGKKTKNEIREDIYNKKLEDAINNYYLTLARKANITVYKP